MLQTCRELGVSVVAYSPIGRGLLGGKLSSRAELVDRDWRRQSPQFTEENLPRNLTLAARVAEVASEMDCTPAQAAIAWVLAQGDDVVTIPGTKHASYLEENVKAANIELTIDQLNRLTSAFPQNAVAGERYSKQGLRTVGH